ncbi:MAG: LacI family transcriptional regulator [Cellvibrionaceae bacterium]|jgi:LacI family transcriptional regulator
MSESLKKVTVTIMDVAKHAGVSFSTVSRVVNNYQFIKPATREKVQQSMDELGYVANLKARSLAGGRSNVIGLLVFDLENSYFTEVVRGIDAEVSALNYDMMISTTHQRREREKTYIGQLASGMVDGLIIMLPQEIESWLAQLQQRNVPYVLIDHESGSGQGHIIRTANRRGAIAATNHLLDLGHTKIGLITGTPSVQSGRERIEGFRQALAERVISADESLIQQGDFDEKSGRACGLKLLQMADRPTAIFALNDAMALGVYEAAESLGLSIPEDLSVMGFDDIPEAKYIRPQLTTVRQPQREIGRTATRLLVDLIENPGRELETITLETELIVRKSTAPVS